MREEVWEEALRSSGYALAFPVEARFILDGIRYGVPVGFSDEQDAAARADVRNPPVDAAGTAKIAQVIAADCAALKKAGPFSAPPFPNFVASPIGAVPKKNSSKVRVIHNLSFPFRSATSVNARIEVESYSLEGFPAACAVVRRLGRGCFLIKLDVEAAYKQIPVRPQDWHLLGFRWDGVYYYERVLPFGLKSSCRIWEYFAHALAFMLKAQGGETVVLHYVDDFLFVASSEEQAHAALASALALCRRLGLPMAADKTEGPTRCLTFLGIELDTDAMEARLPADKLLELARLCELWESKSSASVRELQSLAGVLRHASDVVRPGRFFLRRIIARISVQNRVAHAHAQLPLPAAVLADVAWWRNFVRDWNGHSLLCEQQWRDADAIELFTDACLTGFGAWFGQEWFYGTWNPDQITAAMREQRASMPFLELHALVQAAATWGSQWTRLRITFRSDCMPVVDCLNSGESRDAGMQHLLRLLCTIACKYSFHFRAIHIPGVLNVRADLLSRGMLQEFRAISPDALPQPVQPPLLPLP